MAVWWLTTAVADFLACLSCRHGWWDVLAFTGDFGPDFERRARSEGKALVGVLNTFRGDALDEAVRYMQRTIAAHQDQRLEELAYGTPVQQLLRDVAWESTFDAAPDGTTWVLGAPPACPRCESRHVVWADSDPKRAVPPRPRTVHEITTVQWHARRDSENYQRVADVVEATIEAVADTGAPSLLSTARWLHNFAHQETLPSTE